MRITERMKAAYKAFWGSGDWVNSNLPGNVSTSSRWHFEPQTHLNYAALVGNLWDNSAAQACLNWIMRAWPESYPCVKVEDRTKKRVLSDADDHPLTPLLQWPNSAYDDTVLWAGTILSFWVDGNAYWGINRLNNGDIGEFVYVPHTMIEPKRDDGSRGVGPDYFEYRPNGRPERRRVEDVVHFRFGIDPENPLLGLSGWASVNRSVYTDNEGINYVNNTLRNRGAAWMIVTPSDPATGFSDPSGMAQLIEDKTTGDKRGGVLVLDGGANVTLPPNLKDQSVDTLHRIPETRICALAGIPAMACGLASGLERSTYSNADQADEVAWRTVMAVQRMMGRQLTGQVLRRTGNFYAWEQSHRTERYWAGFDYSEVRALQPDKQAEWDRIGTAYERGLLLEDEARVEMGYEPFTPQQKAEREAAKPEASDGPAEDAEDDTTAEEAAPQGNGSRNGTGRKDTLHVSDVVGPTDWAARVAAELDILHGGSA